MDPALCNTCVLGTLVMIYLFNIMTNSGYLPRKQVTFCQWAFQRIGVGQQVTNKGVLRKVGSLVFRC